MKKIIYHIVVIFIGILNFLSARKAMTLYLILLRFCGVHITGNPRFISTRIRIDEFNLIHIGSNSVISENVVLLTHDYSCTNALRVKNRIFSGDISIHKPIHIGSNSFVGLGVIILPGTVIGDNVIVGAGAVVKGNLESNNIYIGNPARSIGTIEDYADKLDKLISENIIDIRIDKK